MMIGCLRLFFRLLTAFVIRTGFGLILFLMTFIVIFGSLMRSLCCSLVKGSYLCSILSTIFGPIFFIDILTIFSFLVFKLFNYASIRIFHDISLLNVHESISINIKLLRATKP